MDAGKRLDLSALEVVGESIQSNDCRAEAERDAWLKERRGKITGSRFPDLVKEGRAKGDLFTVTGYNYLREVVAERLGSYVHDFTSRPTEWGNQNEREAIMEGYAKRTGSVVNPNPFGLILWTVNPNIGDTPDALVGSDGVLEVKCPWNPGIHIKTAQTGAVPDQYLFQVYGHLLVTGREWCDFISYDPRLKGKAEASIRIRVERDDLRIKFLGERLRIADEWVEEQVDKIRTRAAVAGDGLYATVTGEAAISCKGEGAE